MTNRQSIKIDWQFLPASALGEDPTQAALWDQLNANVTAWPFLDAFAVSTAIAVFGNGSERLVIGRVGDKVNAMLVLQKIDAFRWTSFQPSQLPLGANLLGRELPIDVVTRSLVSALPGIAQILSLTQLDPLFTPRQPSAATMRFDDYIETGWIELTGTFDDYWGERGKNLRHNMRKQRNRLDADNITTSLRSLSGPKDMADAVVRYGTLESAGWKSEHGTAIHSHNDQGRFFRRLLENAAARNEAVVFEYWFNDELAASNLCLRCNKALVILKTTYDERHTRLSPAYLLLQDEIELFCTSGEINRIEFYGRMKDWHTRWTKQKRMLYHLTVYRSAWIRPFVDMMRKTANRAS